MSNSGDRRSEVPGPSEPEVAAEVRFATFVRLMEGPVFTRSSAVLYLNRVAAGILTTASTNRPI